MAGPGTLAGFRGRAAKIAHPSGVRDPPRHRPARKRADPPCKFWTKSANSSKIMMIERAILAGLPALLVRLR